MKKYSWVYRNIHTDDLVLVKRPQRYVTNGKYRVIKGNFRRNGYRADTYLGESVCSMEYKHFKALYKYVGGLNIRPRYGKKHIKRQIHLCSPFGTMEEFLRGPF